MEKIIYFDKSKTDKNGKLIVVEGPDGIGKTTLIENLALYLKASNNNPLVLANPNPDSIKYNEIKQLLNEEIQDTDKLQQLMLQNYLDLYNKTILKHLKNKPNNIVILDRWIISTIIYNIIENGSLYKSISSGSYIWDGLKLISNNDSILSQNSKTILIDFYYLHFYVSFLIYFLHFLYHHFLSLLYFLSFSYHHFFLYLILLFSLFYYYFYYYSSP